MFEKLMELKDKLHEVTTKKQFNSIMKELNETLKDMGETVGPGDDQNFISFMRESLKSYREAFKELEFNKLHSEVIDGMVDNILKHFKDKEPSNDKPEEEAVPEDWDDDAFDLETESENDGDREDEDGSPENTDKPENAYDLGEDLKDLGREIKNATVDTFKVLKTAGGEILTSVKQDTPKFGEKIDAVKGFSKKVERGFRTKLRDYLLKEDDE